MKILIVYDSVYGNTEKIAQAIAGALPASAGAAVVKPAEAGEKNLSGVKLLFVGSPTQAFRPLKPVTAFLRSLPAGSLKGVRVAAFDTRMDVKKVNNALLTFMESVFGYAAKPISDGLAKKGGRPAAEPEGFFVEGSEGPLREGELERAGEWGKRIYQNVVEE
jgi:flavodoxin